MNLPPRILVVISVVPLLWLAGCSGGDDDPGPTAEPLPLGERVVSCRADVAVDGAADAAWKGRAKVNLRNSDDQGAGPEARYTSGHGGSALSVFSQGPDFEPTITLAVDGVAYSSGEDPDGLRAKADGRRVVADGVTMTGPQQAELTLRASFTCQKADATG